MAQNLRERKDPLVLRRGARQQWLHMTKWHVEEDFSEQYPLGLWLT